MDLPFHLRRYVVEQDYSRYTPQDQAVWRYIMRQLRSYLSVHAHPCYADGLAKTGIEIDRIPDISKMSEKLQRFGWQAVPVSGFIPPAAFMELQSLGYLPIASDMRTIDHLLYTPAPDIVHEAAGHAPILINTDFAAYLKRYAQVARNAIISRQDLDQYEAIRVLSDLKESSSSTEDEIKAAERNLEQVTRNMGHISEAALLGRMNWWTAEYGLIGTLENPKIFGAGLLSSVGEARACLQPKVKKIPLSVDCIEYSYDITEQQPQLFVTPDFETLGLVLDQLADRMAFRIGGLPALEKAIQAESVNTVQLNSGLQVSGRLAKVHTTDANGASEVAYLQFQGPTQLSLQNSELSGHGVTNHAQGFGTPVGLLAGTTQCLSKFRDSELSARGITVGKSAELAFKSGVRVKGTVTGWLRSPSGDLALLNFRDCRVTFDDQVLFDPSWGTFDMGVGSSVTSVFGGPADRRQYGQTQDFVAKVVPRKTVSDKVSRLYRLYARIRDLREEPKPEAEQAALLEQALRETTREFPNEWLPQLEVLELSRRLSTRPAWEAKLRSDLEALTKSAPQLASQIEDGLKLIEVQ